MAGVLNTPSQVDLTNTCISVECTYHIYSVVVLFVKVDEVILSNVAMLATIEVLGEVIG